MRVHRVRIGSIKLKPERVRGWKTERKIIAKALIRTTADLNMGVRG